MAAHLNKPADFITGSDRTATRNPSSQINMELPPPSMFQSTKFKPDARKELAKVTSEILQLKEENQRLKFTMANKIAIPSDSEINANVKIVKQVSGDDGKYADELISRQATEIDKLKGELRRVSGQYEEQIGELSTKLAAQGREHGRSVASLRESLTDRDRRYEEQVDRLSYEHQKESEDLTAQLDTVTTQLTEYKSGYCRRIRELEAEVESIRTDASTSMKQLEAEIRSKMATLENQEKQIAQMKTYIGEAEKTYKPAEAWVKENETLQNKLKILQAEKENLESNIELLNVRLSSITKILNVQECEISKAKASHLDKNKQESLLISRWRDKVFALLVQLESAEIIRKKNDQNWTYKVSDLEEKLSSANSDLEVLSHSLSVKTAELQMQMNNNKVLQVELTQAQQIALALDDQLRENRDHMEQLVSYVQSVDSKYEATFAHLQATLSTLKTYSQRISFASSRIDMLQGQFSRRDALLRLQYGDKQTTEGDQTKTDFESMPSASHICEELERVTTERDVLAAQMKEDSLMWNGRLDQVRSQYENEIISLKKTVEDLEFMVQEKSQTCATLSERLEQCQAQLEELSERNEDLKTNLAKHQLNMQKALEEQKAADESRFAEAFAELDRKLNEAKREATKTVICLRQLERQSGREKERAAEQLRTTEEHYQRQLQKLQEKLVAIERDRNMLMATLRQEGLISRARSDRGEPVHLESEEGQQEHEGVVREQQDPQPDEPLESVLEDLKVLTAAVMNEDQSPDEDNEDY